MIHACIRSAVHLGYKLAILSVMNDSLVTSPRLAEFFERTHVCCSVAMYIAASLMIEVTENL